MSKIEPNTQEELTLQRAWKEQIALDSCGLRSVPAVSQELFWVLLYSDGTSRQDIQVHFVCGHLGISMLYLLCMLHTAGTPLKSVCKPYKCLPYKSGSSQKHESRGNFYQQNSFIAHKHQTEVFGCWPPQVEKSWLLRNRTGNRALSSIRYTAQ